MTQITVDPALQSVDEVLARQRPFGDSEYIANRLRAVYERRLIKLSDQIPVAGDIVDSLAAKDPIYARRVLADTTVRTVIEHLRRAVATGTSGGYNLTPVDLCHDVLEALLDHLKTGLGRGPLNLSSGPRVGPMPYHPWIWVDDRPAGDPFAKAYRWLIEAHYGGMPRPARDADVSALQRGAQLLEELLPTSAPSVMGHTQVVAVIPASGVWERMQSSSQYLLGGNIFLRDLIFNKPWLVSELLYHESIHQKLYDLRHGHTVLKEDAALDPDSLAKSEVLVESPWNYPDNQWDTHRVLAAFHVYVHVSLLSLRSEEPGSDLEPIIGPRTGQTPARAALDRARYLGEKLAEPQCWYELDAAGQKLVEWLTAVLDFLDEDPPPRGAVLHLLLNRYEREAQRVLRREALSETSYLATLLAKDEPQITLKLLSELHRDSTSRSLRNALDQLPTDDPRQFFAAVRRCIVEALRECGDRYNLPCTESVDACSVVTRMIERSSRLLALGQELESLPGPSLIGTGVTF
jgi:hypothetical protein